MAAAKPKRLFRPMRQEEYLEVLKTHGRRVANRVALAHLPKSQRGGVADFHLCYAPEAGLSEQEMCWTGLINKFDPCGWFEHYDGKKHELHPVPEGMEESEGASAGAMSIAHAADPAPDVEPNDDEASRMLDSEIDLLFDKFINASTANDLSADILAAATRLLATKLFAADTTQQDIAGWLADGIKAHP